MHGSQSRLGRSDGASACLHLPAMSRRSTIKGGVAALLAALICATIFVGCAHIVIVRDSSGLPIEGADVQPVSASMNYEWVRSDARGRARLDWWYPQTPEGLNIRKSGYVQVAITPIPNAWPVEVVLQPIGK